MPLLLAIIGCILLKAERLRALLVVIVLVDITIALTASSFIVHADINVVSTDVCSEFSYSGSMFQLWETSTQIAAAQLSTVTQQGMVSVIEEACASWDSLCLNLPNQVCGNYECNQNTIYSLQNVTVIIDTDGSLKSVSNCVTNCIDGDLRGATEAFLAQCQLTSNVYQSFDSLSLLQADIYSNTSMSRMKWIFCEGYSETIQQLNSGFAVLLVGEILTIGFFFRFGW